MTVYGPLVKSVPSLAVKPTTITASRIQATTPTRTQSTWVPRGLRFTFSRMLRPISSAWTSSRAKWSQTPEVRVWTNVGEAHIGHFGSADRIADVVNYGWRFAVLFGLFVLPFAVVTIAFAEWRGGSRPGDTAVRPGGFLAQ